MSLPMANGVLAAEKSKAKPVAQKSSGKQIAQKNKSSPVTKKETTKKVVAKTSKSRVVVQKPVTRAVVASSVAQWQDSGRLDVQSGAALVVDQEGGVPLYQKNANQVLPIASITKLMTAMVVLDSSPNLNAPITISEDDVDTLRGSRSRLGVGTVLSREYALLLALMSSENRAAHALARHYPGGLPAFISAMNIKAQALGMRDTHFEDPTGLTSNNVSTANDLAKMVKAAHRYPLIREFSTTSEATVDVGGRDLAYRNTNPLVKSTAWDVGLSKTGYIQEAGKCLVMQARVADKPVVIVLLDSAGKLTRVGDANRIKRWMEMTQVSGKTTHARLGVGGARTPG
jgi:D-alanyl-D-alanine endopeptidase (penicillin-binding protein 7)